MRKLNLVLFFSVLVIGANAQGIYNNGAYIVSTLGSYWVVDDGGFTLTSTSATQLAQMDNLRILNDASLTLPANSKLTVTGTLNNAGTLAIQSASSSAASGSLITTGSISNTGTMTIQRWVSQGSTATNDYTWHSMGLPIASASSGDYFMGDYLYKYDEPSGSWSNVSASDDNLLATKGFIIKTIAGNKTYNFNGTFNTGELSTGTLNNAGDGFHLISNPYPSVIDLEQLNRTNIGTTFWIWDPSTENYLNYTIGDGNDERYILPCQAFFVYSTGNGSITFDNNDRLHSAGSTTFKSGNAENIYLNLKVTGNDYYDELEIQVNENENYGFKLFSMNPETPQLFAVDNGKQYCRLNILQLDENTIIPLGFKTIKDGTYKISVSGDIDDFGALLKDKNTGTTFTLNEDNAYVFTHSSVNAENRFDLLFKKSTLDIITSDTSEYFYKLFTKDDIIHLQTNNIIGEAYLYSIGGELLEKQKINNNNLFKTYLSGIYVIKIITNEKMYSEKIIVL